MKKQSGYFFFLLFPFVAQAQDVVLIKDHYAEQRNVGSFHGVKISHAMQVIMKQSSEEGVAVSASEEKYRDRIKVENKEGVLWVSFDAKGLGKWRTDGKLRAYIAFRHLRDLDISGASDVKVEGVWRDDEVNINLSGASSLKAEVDFSRLNIKQSGASNAKMAGKAGGVQIDVNGASDFKGFDLLTDVCTAVASGASDIQITVNKDLKVNASGASDVSFRGSATISELRTSGAGTVKKKR